MAILKIASCNLRAGLNSTFSLCTAGSKKVQWEESFKLISRTCTSRGLGLNHHTAHAQCTLHLGGQCFSILSLRQKLKIELQNEKHFS